jgi:hypothetical protein
LEFGALVEQVLRQAQPQPQRLDTLLALVERDGSAQHSFFAHVAPARGGEYARNLADAIHFLCALHGRHPGVVDHAAWRTKDGEARNALEALANWFDAERALLTRLVVAVGPLPSTPAQVQSESIVLAQRHALEMLAKSERSGCASGATIALALDWSQVRPLVDQVADRLLVPAPANPLPSGAISRLGETIRTEAEDRAAQFGAQQLLAQHRGLWDLLESRAVARAASPL